MILRYITAPQRCARCNTELIKYQRCKGLCRRCYTHKYQRARHFKSIEAMHQIRFDHKRELVILRDDEQCTICGLTRREHHVLYGRDIAVHHIDFKGRYSPDKNQSINNMQTICLGCLGRISQEQSGGWRSPEAKAKSLANLQYLHHKN